MRRLTHELACLWEFWLLPLVVALLPYRAGVAFARWCAARLSLYDENARAGLAHYRAACPRGDPSRWLAEFRFTQLIDHADLFWALTRSERFLLSRLDAPPRPGAPPLMVISMHFGQGLFLLPWLRAGGTPARFVSVRFDATAFESRLRYLYARLRMRIVEKLAGVPAIYTGGARGEIAATFAQGGAVYGLIDVPTLAASDANASLFGSPIFWPSGLVDAARSAGVETLLLTAHCATDGRRHIAAERTATLAVADIASRFGARIDALPGAWHVWHFLSDFAVSDAEARALV
ncbi:MAG TPA: hypothetical protein VFJ68_13495 [Casimicrobiaceae bacterium]|nr:hypothetical protein [Casimicrobiaceae bacterium]